MSKSLEHLAALSVILFFIPFRMHFGGIELYLADVIGLVSIGFLALIAAQGKLQRSTLKASGFILLFISYIFLSGMINDAPLKEIFIEMLQWLSIVAFLGILHQTRFLASTHFLSLIALYAFLGALFTALWHLMQPDLPDFKQLENTKYLFGFSCALLYLMRKHIRFSTLFLILAVIILLMSHERKALLAFVVMIFADFFLCQPKNKHSALNIHLLTTAVFGAIFISILAFIYWLDVSTLLETFEVTAFDLVFADQFQTQWNSDLWRKLLISNGLSLFLEHPVFGVGPKMLPHFLAPYFQNIELVNYTHNFILDIAIEYGLIGVTLLLGGFLFAMKTCFKQRIQNPVSFLLAVYIFVMVFFVAVNSTIMLMFLLPFFIDLHAPISAPLKTKITIKKIGKQLAAFPQRLSLKKPLTGEEHGHI